MIENTQRDLNIALMNELALIFGKLIGTADDPSLGNRNKQSKMSEMDGNGRKWTEMDGI